MWAEAVSEARKGLECPHITREALEGLYVALATAKMKTGQVSEAMKIMEDATEVSPELFAMDLRRVKLLYLQKKLKEAKQLGEDIIRRIEHQVRCAPAASDLWSILGDCCSLLGQLDKAREAYTQATKFNAMDSEAVRGLGVLAEKDGDFDLAIQLFNKFTVLEPLNLSTPPLREKIKELKQKVGV
jgi:tetratricopeptide (TPR) repeat protein